MDDLQIQRDMLELIKTVGARVDVLTARVNVLCEEVERLEHDKGVMLDAINTQALNKQNWYNDFRAKMMKELDGDNES